MISSLTGMLHNNGGEQIVTLRNNLEESDKLNDE